MSKFQQEESHIPQEENLSIGPFSLLTEVTKANDPVLISCRNNRKILGRVKAFDRHMNLVLEDVTETWVEHPRGNKGRKAKPVQRERVFSKLFMRGDSVIFIVKMKTD